MKYYVLVFDDRFDSIKNEEVPSKYGGISLNLGMSFNELPEIKLTLANRELPNCIPNFQRYLYFDEKVRGIIASFKVDSIDYFAVKTVYENGDQVDKKYYLANVRNLVNAIDREKSKLEIDEEEEDEEDNIRFVNELYLNHQKIGDEIMFRLIGFETLLIVREDLAQELVNQKCTGLEFYDADGYIV